MCKHRVGYISLSHLQLAAGCLLCGRLHFTTFVKLKSGKESVAHKECSWRGHDSFIRIKVCYFSNLAYRYVTVWSEGAIIDCFLSVYLEDSWSTPESWVCYNFIGMVTTTNNKADWWVLIVFWFVCFSPQKMSCHKNNKIRSRVNLCKWGYVQFHAKCNISQGLFVLVVL